VLLCHLSGHRSLTDVRIIVSIWGAPGGGGCAVPVQHQTLRFGPLENLLYLRIKWQIWRIPRGLASVSSSLVQQGSRHLFVTGHADAVVPLDGLAEEDLGPFTVPGSGTFEKHLAVAPARLGRLNGEG
jgi:hypothetical protein